MSQAMVLQLLQELGGRATGKQIRQAIENKHGVLTADIKRAYASGFKALKKWQEIGYSLKTDEFWLTGIIPVKSEEAIARETKAALKKIKIRQHLEISINYGYCDKCCEKLNTFDKIREKQKGGRKYYVHSKCV